MKNANLAILNTPEGRLRLLSAAVLAPVILAVVALGGMSFSALMTLITAIALFEWLRLVDAEAPMTDRVMMYAAHVVVAALAAFGLPTFALIALALATAAFYAHRSNIDAAKALWFAAGLPYMAGSAVALIYLRNTPAAGLANILYLIAAVWGMDIGAYVVGRLVGGPKLAPVISPNKTWSGFCGGMGLAVLLAMPVLLLNHAQHFFRGLLIVMLLAAVAQAGDLFKSFFKRRAGVKDCGSLIPGHGGVLDRIDGLVFAATLLAFLQAVCGNGIIW